MTGMLAAIFTMAISFASVLSCGSCEFTPQLLRKLPSESNDSFVYELGIGSLAVGQTVKVVFRNPNSGRVGLSLLTARGNCALRAAARYDWNGDIDTFLLNTRVEDKWQKRVTSAGFPFPANGVSTKVSLSVTVQEESFLVSANDIVIADFPYRGSLTYDKVDSILWGVNDEAAIEKAVLEQIILSFQLAEENGLNTL